MIQTIIRANLKVKELSWTTVDGLKLFARLWQPIGEVKAVVCLLHGIGEHTGRFNHVGEVFNKYGIALLGADWRGHGKSEGRKGYFPSTDAIIDDIDILIMKATQLFPRVPQFLYGQSLGAILALYYGLVKSPAINGIIATSPALHSSLDKQSVKIAIASILGKMFPEMSLHSGLKPQELSKDPETVRRYIEDPLVHYELTLGFAKILINIRRWMLNNSCNFQVPLLLMHGSDDTIAYISGSKQFALPIGDKCEFITWEGALHELHNEPEKEEVLKTIVTWINQNCHA